MMGVAWISVEPVHECQQARWVFTEEEDVVHAAATGHVALATSTQAMVREQVSLREDKLFVQLGEKSDDGQTRWILDTGATNHMTGVRSAFSELDTGVRGTVRFGDGSMVDIHGRATILFSCKTGEHQRLGGVYYIPRLTANIISLGQLDEDKYKVLIEDGVLRIRDQRR